MTKKQEASKKKTFDALSIILDASGSIRPKDFARRFWPDSPSWSNSRACGPLGRHQGMGMYCSAGCYLGTLAKKGYVIKKGKEYHLTDEGRSFINEAGEYFSKKDAQLSKVMASLTA